MQGLVLADVCFVWGSGSQCFFIQSGDTAVQLIKRLDLPPESTARFLSQALLTNPRDGLFCGLVWLHSL